MSRLTSSFILIILTIACAKFLDAGTPMILAWIEGETLHLNNVEERSPPAQILPAPDGYLRKAACAETGFLRRAVQPETEPASPLEGLEADFYWVTGYSVGDSFTPREITAGGRKVWPGVTMACPPTLVLGTTLYIEGLGIRICDDRGSAIIEGYLDVAFPSPESALIFGRQRLAVVIIR